EVGGPVGRGHGVEVAADTRDRAEDGALGDGRRALELHVLDPVRDAGEAGKLVAATDAVPGPERDDGGVVLLLQEEGEAVVEGDGLARWSVVGHAVSFAISPERTVRLSAGKYMDMAHQRSSPCVGPSGDNRWSIEAM